MILGRANELQYLNNVYAKEGSQLVVLYGPKNIGKTMLISDFIKDKDSVYYLANEASQRQQLYLMSKQWKRYGISVSEYPEFSEVFDAFSQTIVDKKVLVIDEFEHLVKAGTDFIEGISALLHKDTEKQIMIILCSSSVGFVENNMVSKIGKAAYDISGFLKIKELKFADFVRTFPEYSTQEAITAYSILGGIPGLWNYFDPKLSVKENICQNILQNGCFLKEEGSRYIKEEVREGNVYYSILAALAEGKCKLNDLYQHTGFSRAKISVYLKNLMEIEIVEKVFSLDTQGRDNQRKGIYKISNHFVHFWFRYIYPNYSYSMMLQPNDFYEQFIAPTITEYCDSYFAKICREYMVIMNQSGKLPYEVLQHGVFDGKSGMIDYIGQGEGRHYIVAFSSYAKAMFDYNDFEQAETVITQAKIKPDYIYIFSRGGFDEKVTLEAKIKENITLIGMDEL